MKRAAERLEHDAEYQKIIELSLKDPAGLLKRTQTALCSRPGGLIRFVKLMWQFVEPARPFIANWHITAICDHLEAVTAGKITRLLINVPPGFAKPVSIDTLVQMGSGERRCLRDIGVGDQIVNGQGRLTTVTAVHKQGSLPNCLRIITESGREIIAAVDHPFLTPEGWIVAKDLAIGQYLALLGGREQQRKKNQHKDAEFILAGYLIGDGSVTRGKGGLSCEMCSITSENLTQARQAAETLGFNVREYRPSAASHKDFCRLLFSNGARDWLCDIGLDGKSSRTKRVPDFVYEGTNEQVAMFIATYFQCDGSVYKQHKDRDKCTASIGSVSKDLLLDVSSLLLRLGIQSRVRTSVLKRQTGKMGVGYTTHCLRIGGVDGISKFFNRVPVIGPKRQRFQETVTFTESFKDPDIYGDKIETINDAGSVNCRCLSVSEGSSFIANDFIVHNSLLTNCFFPAWVWGPMKMPSMRFMSASYSQDLTIRDNVRFRQIITSDDYVSRWGDLVQPSKDQFSLVKVGNTKTGFKLATSTNGIGTGERADFILIDDPNSVKDVESDKVRDSTNQWLTEVVPTRINEPTKSSIIIIQQRTHEEDASGIVLSRELGYEHLVIPMRYDSSRRYTTSIGWTDPRGIDADGNEVDADGALAWPEMYPEFIVDRLEATLGPYAASGQLAQAPVPRGGAIFERDWWQAYPISEDGKVRHPPMEYVVASVDTAFSEKQESDFSAMTIWGVYRDSGQTIVAPRYVDDPAEMMRLSVDERPKVMLLGGWQKRLNLHGPPDDRPFNVTAEEWNAPWWRTERQKTWGLVEWVIDTCRKWHIDMLLIETQAAGLPLIQELRRLHSNNDWGVQMIAAKGDKVSRAIAVQHLFSNGLIHVPTYPDSGLLPTWATTIVDQFSSFPKTRYKDLVDSGTHALQHLRDLGVLVRKEEHDFGFEQSMRLPKRSKPLYEV